MPHPPIEDQDKRTVRVTVLLSPREHAAISALAGGTVRAWMRDAALEKAGITDTVRRSAPRRGKGQETVSEKWVAYDAVSGDVLADGTERQVHRYVSAEDAAAEGRHSLVAASEAEWQRASKVIAKRMSGNPPRRNPSGIEHL